LVVLSGVAACGNGSSDPSADDPSRSALRNETTPDIHGTITRSAMSSGRQTILVEENPAERWGSLKALTTINSTTAVMRRTAQGDRWASFADLAEGKTVQVWFEGPVAESYPVQALAKRVIILN
jgi:hypothetical protein